MIINFINLLIMKALPGLSNVDLPLKEKEKGYRGSYMIFNKKRYLFEQE